MSEDKSTAQAGLKWFNETEIKEAGDMERKPSLKKTLKEKFGSDGKPMHKVRFKFLNEGNEFEQPDFSDKTKMVKKRVFEVEYEGAEYAFYVIVSVTATSMFGQIVKLAKANEGITNVETDMTIVGKLGDKTVRYVLEPVPKK